MTPDQQQNLLLFVHFRGKKMTTWNLLWAIRNKFVPAICSFAILIAIGYLFAGPKSGHLFLGMSLLLLVQSIQYAKKNAEFWPVMEKVLDWEKVENAISASQADGAS
jgi:hypothetical protein